MRDPDRQSEVPAAHSPFHERQRDRARSLQASWWARACAAVVLCAAAAIASSAQTFTTLHKFHYQSDGAYPFPGLIQATDGNLYGVASYGGSNGGGVVFKVTASGNLIPVYSLDGLNGQAPSGALIQDTDGNFYGPTKWGGTDGYGTIFKLTPSGTLTTLHSFCTDYVCPDGAYPFGSLLHAGGALYGTTAGGGAYGDEFCGAGCGTVFKISPGGTLTTLASFDDTDGREPYAGLIEANDGNFYGTTYYGGVFKITPDGALTVLYSFAGGDVWGGLVQGTDGDLYGTTGGGGANNSGTVFKIALNGTLTTIYNFCSQSDCTDGAFPQAGLIQATDGNFYGTTTSSGANGWGTIFRVTAGGTLTTLYNFCSLSDCADGTQSDAALIQDTNGNFYGTTNLGGDTPTKCPSGCGTVFSLSVGLGPFVETQTTSGKVGAHVNILGTNLTGATSVTFNGTAATFTVVSPSLITTTVPAGATTGRVQVVTPGGTLSSNVPFRVIQ